MADTPSLTTSTTSMTSTISTQRLVFSILEWLQELSSQNGITPDGFRVDPEAIEVASQCLSNEFKISLNNPQHQQYSIKPLSLPTVFALGLQRKEDIQALFQQQQQQQQQPQQQQQQQQQPPKEAESPLPTQPMQNETTAPQVSESESVDQLSETGDAELDAKLAKFISNLQNNKAYFAGATPGSAEYKDRYQKAKAKFLETHQQIISQLAEKHKNEGNEKLKMEEYSDAVKCYSLAIKLNPNNAIYYSNRAAAYSHLAEYSNAISDCESAIRIDPSYAKPYSRLGLAYFSLEKYSEAVESYKKALALDPNNQSMKLALTHAEAKLSSTASSRESSPPGRGGLNFAELLNNPAVKNLVQTFSQNLAQGSGQQDPNNPSTPSQRLPNLTNPADLLNNPNAFNALQQIMSNPSFTEIMNNPAIMKMAENMMQDPNALSQMFQGMFNGSGGTGTGTGTGTGAGAGAGTGTGTGNNTSSNS